MNNVELIVFKRNEIVSLSYLKKTLKNSYQEAIDEDYFMLYDDSEEEPKYIFTQKGFDYAWKKNNK